MHIVPNETTNASVIIIGSDILPMTEMMVNSEGITIRKETFTKFLAQINMIKEWLFNIVDTEIREKVEAIAKSYKPSNCKTTEVNMPIVNKDKKTIFQKLRLPVPKRKVVERQIAEWLNDDIIEECMSDYANPVVVVKKKDGSPRVCIDYRKLNRTIKKDNLYR